MLFAQLLVTKSQTKRKKLAWMLRELFDYREVPDEEKRAVINRLYDFIRDDHQLIHWKKEGKIKGKRQDYRRQNFRV